MPKKKITKTDLKDAIIFGMQEKKSQQNHHFRFKKT
jgi:hypothetical protein